MTDIEELSDIIEQNGTILAFTPLKHSKLAAFSCRLKDERCAIAVDEKKLETNANVKTALLHEFAHCITGTFYNEYTSPQMRQKLEYRADKHVAENDIKKSDIIRASRSGITEIWEFAEYFNITVEYMKRIFYIHFRMEFLS